MAIVRRQPRAHLRAGPQEPPDRAAHHGASHRFRAGVGRFGPDIPIQRGAAHTPVHQPADPGRAHDRVPVQPHENVTARRPFLGAPGYGKTLARRHLLVADFLPFSRSFGPIYFDTHEYYVLISYAIVARSFP